MDNDGKKESRDRYYACPVCKQPLTPTINGLFCKRDGVEYPVKNGIVDFITEDLTKSPNLFLRSADKLDNAAEIYEDPSRYGIVQMMHAELGLPSIEEMATMMTEIVDAENGVGLDVACGTGFFTRPLAQKMRLVYGIDISMGMLEKATESAREKGIGNICFAHASVERLPFPNGVFEGVTCGRALPMFPNTAEALSEMARVSKRGARVAVLTLLKRDLPTLKMTLERLGAPSNLFGEEALEALHLYDVEELERYLSQTGFRGFEYNIYGPYLLFHAEKG